MTKRILLASIMVLMVIAVAYPQNNNRKQFKDELVGFEEVPALSTNGSGEFTLKINNAETELSYELSYSGLEGEVTQAHIHIGQSGVIGGIMLFLCSNLGNGPPGTQPCPPSPATVTGTLTAADVIGTGQGIAAGEFAEVIRAIRAGATYVNVHSNLFPGGEIRSQIRPKNKNKD